MFALKPTQKHTLYLAGYPLLVAPALHEGPFVRVVRRFDTNTSNLFTYTRNGHNIRD